MRSRTGWTLGLGMLCASLGAAEAPTGDGGGRDVSVAIFSTHALHAVTLTPVGASSWVARCVGCVHKSFNSSLHVAGPMEIFAGGTLRVSDDSTGDERTATGLWDVKAESRGKDTEIDVVLTLPSERYVAEVLKAEAASNEPAQSLQAMAIVARTYALNGTHFASRPGHLKADLCDSTECEAMSLGAIAPAIEQAVQATAGETLWIGNHRAQVYFSQSCGGVTEDASAVWPNLRGVPYLRSHADPYCLRHNAAQWHAEVLLSRLAEIARAEGWHVPASIVTAHVLERSVSHRALKIGLTSSKGGTTTVSASALRFGIGRALGWNFVRSDAYEVGVRNGTLIFDGRGHGHGVGLCQKGAAEMASEGKNAREILEFYFSGTIVRIAADDMGWQETRVGPLTLWSTRSYVPERKKALEEVWNEAQVRFPQRHAIAPDIIFAPTTEIFRQLTTQPGWALASTRGSTIVLQPDAVVRANRRDTSATLLHEMLHVLVEDQASERAPRWLREGLVEVLAGDCDKRASANSMPSTLIDGALLHADSLRESELGHRAAAARVRVLIGRYGLSTVRGWLSSGVPAGIT